ncbi:MAG: hypothetical protein ABI666_00320 [Ferruginibacter sp.]
MNEEKYIPAEEIPEEKIVNKELTDETASFAKPVSEADKLRNEFDLQ